MELLCEARALTHTSYRQSGGRTPSWIIFILLLCGIPQTGLCNLFSSRLSSFAISDEFPTLPTRNISTVTSSKCSRTFRAPYPRFPVWSGPEMRLSPFAMPPFGSVALTMYLVSPLRIMRNKPTMFLKSEWSSEKAFGSGSQSFSHSATVLQPIEVFLISSGVSSDLRFFAIVIFCLATAVHLSRPRPQPFRF